MNVDLVICNATIVSPTGQVRGDLLISAGKVAGIVSPGTGEGAEIIAASGLHLLSGGVDAHVHMQDPGLTEREDFVTGTSAAAVGGVTTIVEHNRSLPFVTNADLMREKAAYLAGRSLIDFAQLGGAHPDNVDQHLGTVSQVHPPRQGSGFDGRDVGPAPGGRD